MSKKRLSEKRTSDDGAPMADRKEVKPVQVIEGAAESQIVGKQKKDWIGDQLKRVYDEAAEEPVPDDMLALLNELDDAESDDSSEPKEDE